MSIREFSQKHSLALFYSTIALLIVAFVLLGALAKEGKRGDRFENRKGNQAQMNDGFQRPMRNLNGDQKFPIQPQRQPNQPIQNTATNTPNQTQVNQ